MSYTEGCVPLIGRKAITRVAMWLPYERRKKTARTRVIVVDLKVWHVSDIVIQHRAMGILTLLPSHRAATRIVAKQQSRAMQQASTTATTLIISPQI
jgi:hypothetical protein